MRCGDRYALEKRPGTGLLAGLWGFPILDGSLTEDEIKARFDAASVRPLGKAKHIFTHIEWHMEGYLVECKELSNRHWVTKEDIEADYSIPTAFKTYKKALQYL